MAKTFELNVVNAEDVNNPNEATPIEISLVSNFTRTVLEKHGMNIPDKLVPVLYRVTMRGIALMLKENQSKEEKVGFTFLNENGEFRFGATLSYDLSEEEGEEQSGNWNISYTFDKEDMADIAKICDNHNNTFTAIMELELYNTIYGHFTNPRSLSLIIEELIECLKLFLDTNANDGENVELTMPGVFVATCDVENGTKTFSITPGATIKQLIKNDDGLSTDK